MSNAPDIQFSLGDQLSLSDLMDQLHDLAGLDEGLPDPSTDEGRATRAFFANNWEEAREGLLSRTRRVRVRPLPGTGPRSFSYEVDRPYKCKRPQGIVELAPGPVSGTIRYRPNVLAPDPGSHSVLVFVDSDGFYHPNYSRKHGVLCIGDIPPGPFPLEALIEHLYSIISYQNMDSTNPWDLEAVRYFGTDPDALKGLTEVEPLY
jgi:hypothetical protein